MKLLAIDTATEACSVALSIEGKIFQRFEICPQQHSQRLLPMLDEVLKEAGLRLADLDYLSFGCGPGSFTGVRIAAGMAQGLAFGAGLKVIGVSTLAAMAQQVFVESQMDRAAVAIDARMGEVYFARFCYQQNRACLMGDEQVLAPAEAAKQINTDDYACAGTGWQAYPDELGKYANGQKLSILYPTARHMLTLAEAAVENGEAVTPANVQPVYLRDKVTWKKLPGR